VDFLRPGTQTPSDTGILHGAYTISSLPFTVTTNVQTKSYLVSPLNVAISMTDIVASFDNIKVKRKRISPTKISSTSAKKIMKNV